MADGEAPPVRQQEPRLVLAGPARARLRVDVIAHPVERLVRPVLDPEHGSIPVLQRRDVLELVRRESRDAVVRAYEQLVRVLEVVVDHPLDVAVVPEGGAVPREHLQPVDLDAVDRAVGLQLEADTIELAAVAQRIDPGPVVRVGPVVLAAVADEDLVIPAADDLLDARPVGGARNLAELVGLRNVAIAGAVVPRAVDHRVAGQVQPVADVEPLELRIPRTEHVQGRVRGDPEVLLFVGAHADDGHLLDAVLHAVGDVLHRPRTPAAELGPGVGSAAVGRPRVGRATRVGAACIGTASAASSPAVRRRNRHLLATRACRRRAQDHRSQHPSGKPTHRPSPCPGKHRAPAGLRAPGQPPPGRWRGAGRGGICQL